MEAKKVRKGVGIRFAPVRRLLDMQTTKRLQRSLASYFFPPLPTFPILQSLWGSSGNLRMEVRSLGYRIRSFMGEEEEEEGIGNDVSPKVTDQPEFCRCAFPVDFLCFSSKKKKKNISARRKEILWLSFNPRSIIVITFQIDKIFRDQLFSSRGTTVWTIIVSKLIVVNWCARMKSFPLRL